MIADGSDIGSDGLISNTPPQAERRPNMAQNFSNFGFASALVKMSATISSVGV
jgi:hypothetical protein